MSESRTVVVRWRVRGEGAVRVGLANLREGYSTEKDLPKILGIYHGFAPHRVVILSVVERDEMTDRPTRQRDRKG